MVALCSAALRPTQETWQRFLRHLDSLEKSKKLTSNEVTAILVSAMSDRVLRDVEYDDPADLDAVTLDDVVERVKESYRAKSDAKVQEITEEYAAKLAELEARAQAESERASEAEHTASEHARKRELAVERRAQTLARRIALGTSWLVGALVIAGAVTSICGHPFHLTGAGIVIALSVVVFVLLELVGILRHVSEWRSEMEAYLTKRFRTWLDSSAT